MWIYIYVYIYILTDTALRLNIERIPFGENIYIREKSDYSFTSIHRILGLFVTTVVLSVVLSIPSVDFVNAKTVCVCKGLFSPKHMT